MIRQVFFFSCLFCLLLGMSLTFGCARDMPLVDSPIRIRESKPITVNGASFVTVAQTEWIVPKSGDKPKTIETQLRISNLRKTDLIFITTVTFELTITKEDGTEIKPSGGFLGSFFPRPILLSPGASYCITGGAKLTWDTETKAATLLYRARSGEGADYGPLHVGKYKLAYRYSNARDPVFAELLLDNAPVWQGDIHTPEVWFDVIAPRIPQKVTNGGGEESFWIFAQRCKSRRILQYQENTMKSKRNSRVALAVEELEQRLCALHVSCRFCRPNR
jgi:hypothetical protein